jgi:flagellum-specific peptidoglycan hydrolase FlgJ/LysM repeat protein
LALINNLISESRKNGLPSGDGENSYGETNPLQLRTYNFFSLKMIQYSLLFSLLLIAFISRAQSIVASKVDSLDAVRLTYITKYSQLAIAEMYKSGIPASVTLAQGILETSAGSSHLAQKANNHFGLKCGTTWEGDTHFQYDDDYNSEGILIPSCFRVYNSAQQGFADRSQFLSDPRKHSRYGQLFQIHPLDYHGWAKGLQSAGYSPNSRYADRLIEYIERYRLYEIDQKIWQHRKHVSIDKRVTYNNGVKMVLLLEGESIEELAQKAGINVQQLILFNDGYWKPNSQPPHGTRVYLEEKRTEWTASEWVFFYVEKGQPLFELAQLLGIKIASLRTLNAIGMGHEPIFPAKLRIQGKRSANETIPTSSQKILPSTRQPRKAIPRIPQLPMNSNNQQRLTQLLSLLDASFLVGNPSTSPSHRIHLVEKGDTLLGLSRKYGITVNEIKRVNNLIEDTIQVGQQLRI